MTFFPLCSTVRALAAGVRAKVWFVPWLCGLMAAMLLSGCAGAGSEGADRDSDPAGDLYYEVKAEDTPFYRLGPQQARGPDLRLERGRVVKLVKKGFGYSKVQLENGHDGYVATADIFPSRSRPDQMGDVGIGLGLMPDPGASDAIVERYYVDPETGAPVDLTLGGAVPRDGFSEGFDPMQPPAEPPLPMGAEPQAVPEGAPQPGDELPAFR